MSIKKEPFSAMVRGHKKHEFRRKFSEVRANFLVVFYVSSPVKSIMGVAEFGPAIKDKISVLLDLARTHTWNHPLELTAEYFAGCEYGYALPVVSIEKLKDPISLGRLRELVPGFRPPQSYLSLDNQKYSRIKKEVPGYGA
ncbi:MAG: hypothetical protein ABH814_03370 [bacterium]